MMIESVYKSETLGRFFEQIRQDLNTVYHFRDCNPGIYCISWEHVHEGKLPNDLMDMAISCGISEEEMRKKIGSFRPRGKNGMVFSTRKKYRNFDYVIVIPLPAESEEYMAGIIGEEVVHGEHHVLHDGKYDFGEFEKEFLGSTGFFFIYDRILRAQKRKGVREREIKIPDAMYDKESGVVNIDMGHLFGYQLGYEAFDTLPLREFFHASDRRTLWKIYNNFSTPNLKFSLPSCVSNDGPDICREIENILFEKAGLKCTIHIHFYDSDSTKEDIRLNLIN